jgi:hypothetical protein
MNTQRQYLPGVLALLTVLTLGGLTLLVWAATRPLAAAPAFPSAAAPNAPADGTESLPPGVQIQTVIPSMGYAIAMVFDYQGRLF